MSDGVAMVMLMKGWRHSERSRLRNLIGQLPVI